MTNILWVAKGHLWNSYTGVDGGSNIRIPLINELHDRGCGIDFAVHPLDMEMVPASVKHLGIEPYEESCSESIRKVYELDDSYLTFDNFDAMLKDVDVVYAESRPSYMYRESYMLNVLIQRAQAMHKLVLVTDQDIWSENTIDFRLREHMVLLRPYAKAAIGFPHQQFAPYFHHPVHIKDITPRYDVVYVGNRYEREMDFVEMMKPLARDGCAVLVSGDWLQKAPYIVRMFPTFTWIGSTQHSYTFPLLKLGRCTLHVGRPIMRQYGQIPMRPFEAYMADRPCFVQNTEFETFIYPTNKYANGRSPLIIDDGDDVISALDSSSFDKLMGEQSKCLGAHGVSSAAATILEVIDTYGKVIV